LIVFIVVILLLAFFVVYFDATFSFTTAPQSLSLSRTSTSLLLPLLRPARPDAEVRTASELPAVDRLKAAL